MQQFDYRVTFPWRMASMWLTYLASPVGWRDWICKGRASSASTIICDIGRLESNQRKEKLLYEKVSYLSVSQSVKQ